MGDKFPDVSDYLILGAGLTAFITTPLFVLGIWFDISWHWSVWLVAALLIVVILRPLCLLIRHSRHRP